MSNVCLLKVNNRIEAFSLTNGLWTLDLGRWTPRGVPAL